MLKNSRKRLATMFCVQKSHQLAESSIGNKNEMSLDKCWGSSSFCFSVRERVLEEGCFVGFAKNGGSHRCIKCKSECWSCKRSSIRSGAPLHEFGVHRRRRVRNGRVSKLLVLSPVIVVFQLTRPKIADNIYRFNNKDISFRQFYTNFTSWADQVGGRLSIVFFFVFDVEVMCT